MLLLLCGDMRCYRLLETPLAHHLRTTLLPSLTPVHTSKTNNSTSNSSSSGANVAGTSSSRSASGSTASSTTTGATVSAVGSSSNAGERSDYDMPPPPEPLLRKRLAALAQRMTRVACLATIIALLVSE